MRRHGRTLRFWTASIWHRRTRNGRKLGGSVPWTRNRDWFPRSPRTRSTGEVPSYAPAASPRLPAALGRGLPTGDINRPRSSPLRINGVGARRHPAQIHRVRAGGSLLRSFTARVPLVHLPVSLAGPAQPGSTGTSRRCQGCFPPMSVVSPTGLPSASTALLRQDGGGGLSPHSVTRRLVALDPIEPNSAASTMTSCRVSADV
jgi:hypothetical protein